MKSRARENHIYNNRLTDEINGRASYELEFPNGGLAYVVGNIIQQAAWTDNGKIIFYGAEGYRWPQNELYLVNNTLVDERAMGGRFLTVRPGPVKLKVVNNLILGKRNRYGAIPDDSSSNYTASWSDVAFAQREDYRLKVGSSLLGKALDPGFANGLPLALKREYVHPLNSRPPGGRANPSGRCNSLPLQSPIGANQFLSYSSSPPAYVCSAGSFPPFIRRKNRDTTVT